MQEQEKIRESIEQMLQSAEKEKLIAVQTSSPESRNVRRCKRRCMRCCSIIVDNKVFVMVGLVITIWALIGSDLRLLCTDKPADVVFNTLVLICMSFFVIEIFISSIGQNDYFMSFFFVLDCLSTATMVLDLTWVSNVAFGNSNDLNKSRSSRTARIGAKMGRVIRVLRLIRIVKIYKAFLHEKQEQKKDHHDWDEEEDPDHEEEGDTQVVPAAKESAVGKKLSARMTQKTIIVVLTMLIIEPLLRVDEFEQLNFSAMYAVEDIREAYLRMKNGTGTRDAYEEVVLKTVFFHNWYQNRLGTCPQNAGCSSEFNYLVFWIGIAGEAPDSQLQAIAADAQLRPEKVQVWNSMAASQSDLYNYGTMPSQALSALSSSWSSRCTYDSLTNYGFSVISSAIRGVNRYAVQCPGDLRTEECLMFVPRVVTNSEYQDWHFAVIVDVRISSQTQAQFSLITTAFVCVVLCVASISFSSDANNLVLAPVEQMITKVEAIRDNPLAAMKLADNEWQREERDRKNLETRTWYDVLMFWRRQTKVKDLMETVILEKTIIKLGTLLALGFGEAGARIVSHNMSGADSAGVNAMIKGDKVDCVVGLARIRDFSLATEVMQGKVMTFVNQIAEIVHGVVDECHGAVNKNNGDSFFIIWRTACMDTEEVTTLADMSVIAFANILAAIHRSPLLATYRHHPGLQQRLRNRCRVHMSFGLHYGWAIEGAVGSEYKIDASYLSPNVSIAWALEQSTRAYGTSIIISESVARLCHKKMMSKLRLMDKVIIKGSTSPLELYSLDLDFMCLEALKTSTRTFVWNTAQRFRSRRQLELEKLRLWEEDNVLGEFESNEDITAMRRIYTEEFMQVFNMGYQNYSQGEWRVARSLLTKTLTYLYMEDGPSAAILKYMQLFDFQAPKTWQGVHLITDLA